MTRVLVALALLSSVAYADDRCKKLDEKTQDLFGRGEFHKAFDAAKKAVACEPTEKRLVVTVLAACQARNEAGMKIYLAKLPEKKRAEVYQRCRGTCRGAFGSDNANAP
jgi:hypothetical protein